VTTQVVFYGYGTGWHWCYYFPLTVNILNSTLALSALRYRLVIWNGLPFVKALTVMIVLSTWLEGLLPIPVFVTAKMLDFVPFRSPAWTLVYYYIIVWRLLCGASVVVLVSMWL
jgi:hypothetical protein